jgi:Skp family chaperone for outer membrane proteins
VKPRRPGVVSAALDRRNLGAVMVRPTDMANPGRYRVSRKQIVIALAVVLLVAAAGTGAWFLWGANKAAPVEETASSAPANSGTAPTPVVVVIDRNAIMEMSEAGRDIGRQVQDFSKQTRGQLDGQIKSLQSQGEALQREASGLAPDVRQKRIADLEKKQAALQSVVASKDAQVRSAVEKGRVAMEKVLAPILAEVTKEHGVNLVLDKQAVLFATSSTFDITPEVIQKLNARLPAVKIDFNAPPDQPK